MFQKMMNWIDGLDTEYQAVLLGGVPYITLVSVVTWGLYLFQ